jgi:hypothetical protein
MLNLPRDSLRTGQQLPGRRHGRVRNGLQQELRCGALCSVAAHEHMLVSATALSRYDLLRSGPHATWSQLLRLALLAEYLDSDMLSRLNLQKDGLWLFRNMLCPGVPQLAFVGCEVRRAATRTSHCLLSFL